MKIDSPSSITSREASIRLEWISTRILPGVAVLLLSIPLCQWADSNLPDGIIPVSIIYLMIVIILWSMYMAVQYAFVGIAQTWKNKTHACNNQTATNESTAQKPVFLLEAMPIVAESNVNESVCNAEVVEEIAEKTIATDSKVILEEANPDNEPSTVATASASSTYQQGIDDFYQSQAESQKIQIPKSYRKKPIIPTMSHALLLLLLPVRPISKVLMTFIRVRQKARRRNWIPFMNTFYTSCLLLYTRKTWTSSVQTF